MALPSAPSVPIPPISIPSVSAPGASLPVPPLPSASPPAISTPSFSTSVVPTVTSAIAGITGSSSTGGQPAASVAPTLDPSAAIGGTLAPVTPFNPQSPGNVAVNFGLPGTEVKGSLLETCADPNVDIVILGFLSEVTYGASIYPRLQLNPCITSTQTSQMKRLAPGLSHYPTIEADIAQCQTKHGKKILLSIGGQGNTLPLVSDEDAISFANHVWELFGPVGHIDAALRPFGSAVLDGFDLSKQDECAANFDTLAATLRSHFAADTARDYFLSAAPSCSYPDISIHPGYLAQSNFVWPRFFNDSKCGIGSDGFLGAVRAWSTALKENVLPARDSTPSKTHLYIGLSAATHTNTTDTSNSTATVKQQDVDDNLAELLKQARETMEQVQPEGFGGVMAYSGSDSGSMDGLEGFLGVVEKALAWV